MTSEHHFLGRLSVAYHRMKSISIITFYKFIYSFFNLKFPPYIQKGNASTLYERETSLSCHAALKIRNRVGGSAGQVNIIDIIRTRIPFPDTNFLDGGLVDSTYAAQRQRNLRPLIQN